MRLQPVVYFLLSALLLDAAVVYIGYWIWTTRF